MKFAEVSPMFYWNKINPSSFCRNILVMLLSFIAAISAKAQEEQTEKYILPPYLIHAGDKKVLMEDIRQKGVSQDVWDKFIMSGNGNFDGLPDFRRGLYGVVPEDLSRISLYGEDQWHKGKENWAMIIHIKPECRKNVVENYQMIYDDLKVIDDPFTLWLMGKNRTITLSPETIKYCTVSGMDKFWNVSPFYGLNTATPEQKKRSQICGGVIQSYFNETKAKIVNDPVNGEVGDYSSWAIRDRSCIEKITGTPEDLFQGLILGKLNKNVIPEFFGDHVKPSNRPWVNLYLMINIFSEAPGFLKANWKKVLRKFMIETDMQFADERIKTFSEEPHYIKNGDFETVGYYLIKYNSQCAQKKKLPELQALYKNYLDWFFARTKQCNAEDNTDPVCRWGINTDLNNWKQISSVSLLVREAKKLCELQ
ncbi:MAG: hypothetical protein ACXWRZ_02610 [Bdellovibrio sp.]